MRFMDTPLLLNWTVDNLYFENLPWEFSLGGLRYVPLVLNSPSLLFINSGVAALVPPSFFTFLKGGELEGTEVFLRNGSFITLFVSMIFYWITTAFSSTGSLTLVHPNQTPLSTSEGSNLSDRSLIRREENKSKVLKSDTIFSSFTKLKNGILNNFGTMTMIMGNFLLTCLLIFRWRESGHFPLSNLYESLMFLSWSCTFIHLFLEFKTKIGRPEATLLTKLIGSITSPSALFTNAFATFSLPPEMQKASPLVPALQSNWLMMHVTVMIISYSALILGSLLSIAFLILINPQPLLALPNFFFSFWGASLPFSRGQGKHEIQNAKDSKKNTPKDCMPLQIGDTRVASTHIKGGLTLLATQPLFLNQSPPYITIHRTPGLPSSLNYLEESAKDLTKKGTFFPFFSQTHQKFLGNTASEAPSEAPHAIAKPPINEENQYARATFPLYSFFSSLPSTQALASKPLLLSPPKSSLSEAPQGEKGEMVGLLRTAGKEKADKGIGNQKLANLAWNFDNLSYRVLGIGFPFLTIGILSGAVWANEAWGSYWSWDPKETWALLTWLIFAIYLHARITKGWQGKKPAIIASFGFLAIWICFLGVNLIGEGLHSYGWFS